MSEFEKDKLANEIAERVAQKLMEKRNCPCGLGERHIENHNEHHAFIAGLMDGVRNVKKSVINVVVATTVAAVLGLIWLGFKANVR